MPIKTPAGILETILALPANTKIEIHAPMFQVYAEDPEFIFNEVRKQGCRYVDIDNERIDLSNVVPDSLPGNPHMTAVVDSFVIGPEVEKQLKAGIEHALRVGDSLITIKVIEGLNKAKTNKFMKSFGSSKHALVYGGIGPDFFMFNNPESACRTCGGIGSDKQTHEDLLITNPERSIRDGCFLKDVFQYRPDTHRGYTLYSLSQKIGFSLDEPWQSFTDENRHVIMHGLREPLQLQIPPDTKVKKTSWLRHPFMFHGIAGGIERHYRWYRQRDVPNSGMEEWLDEVDGRIRVHGLQRFPPSRFAETLYY